MKKPAFLALLLLIAIAPAVDGAQKRRSVRHPAPSVVPVAVNDSYVATQAVSLSINAPGVLTNDTLNQGTIVSYGATTGTEQTTVGNATPTAQSGTVTLRTDGGFVYTSGAGFTGTDSFRYSLGGAGNTVTAQVQLSVIPTPPTAADDSYSTTRNTQLSVIAPGLLENDGLNGATLKSFGASTGSEQTTLGAVTPTAGAGTVLVNADGSFSYQPPTGFTGNDTFKYVVQNVGGSATASVTINITAPPPVITVSSPGFFYVFSGVSGQNPVLTLKRGTTYTFEISTDPVHPFEILDAPAGSVTNNNIFDGTLTFRVPATDASYRYICSLHGFGNRINTVP